MTSLSERLVQQLVRLQQRDTELERERATLRKKEELKAVLQERLTQAQEQVQKIESIRATLDALNRAAEEKYEQARKDDAAEREKLSERLRVAIDAVNTYSEEVVQLEAKAQHENKSLKDQLEIYAKYHVTGREKYDQVMQARKTEYAKIVAKRDVEQARIPELEKELSEGKKALEDAKREHSELQEQVNGWVKQFSDIQQRLMKARDSFQTAKEERERRIRRIHLLEEDIRAFMSRAEKSKAESNKEHAKVIAIEEKISTHKKQTEKLLAVVATLDSGGAGHEMGVNC